MKGSRMFFIGIIVIAILLFLLQLQMPQRFSWKPSFNTHDRQPFGCYVFDSIMSHTLGNGNYKVTHKTFRQLNHEKDYKGCNVLVTTTQSMFGDHDMLQLDTLLHRGARVLIAYAPYYYTDSLFCKKYGVLFRGREFFNIRTLKQRIDMRSIVLYDTLRWQHHTHGYPPAAYSIYKEMVSSTLDTCHTKNGITPEIIAQDYSGQNERVFMDSLTVQDSISQDEWEEGTQSTQWVRDTLNVLARVRVGKGELIFSSMPLAMTNYGVLDRELSPYVHRLMAFIADRPIVRTTAYMETPEMEAARLSPFRYLLSQRPLRWGLWLSLLLIALFMVFTARRRQRVIPIETPPRNHTLEFVQLIGTLYYQRRDHANLLRKKHAFFAEELRNHLGIDITEKREDPVSVPTLSKATGMDEQEISSLLRDVRSAVEEKVITEAQLRQLIARMKSVEAKL